MPKCIVKDNCRVAATIKPWSHGNPVNLLIPAGKDCEVNEAGAGTFVATIKYPRHTVTATLPADVVALA